MPEFVSRSLNYLSQQLLVRRLHSRSITLYNAEEFTRDPCNVVFIYNHKTYYDTSLLAYLNLRSLPSRPLFNLVRPATESGLFGLKLRVIQVLNPSTHDVYTSLNVMDSVKRNVMNDKSFADLGKKSLQMSPITITIAPDAAESRGIYVEPEKVRTGGLRRIWEVLEGAASIYPVFIRPGSDYFKVSVGQNMREQFGKFVSDAASSDRLAQLIADKINTAEHN